jgi:hypothetical protein
LNPDGYLVLEMDVSGTGNAAADMFLGRLTYTLTP